MNPPLRKTIPLKFRKVFKKGIKSTLLIVTVWVILSVFVLNFVVDQPSDPEAFIIDRHHLYWYGWVAGLLVVIALKTAYQFLYYLTYFYDIEGENLTVRKGVLAKDEITLPFVKITDVNIDRDIIDVFFGLYDVHFATPTQASEVQAHIDGLDYEGAHELRNLILERVNRSAPAAKS